MNSSFEPLRFDLTSPRAPESCDEFMKKALMRSYADVLEEVFGLSKTKGTNPSLATIRRLCKIYNHPEKTFPTIHVAGTNGKGSVCTKIASALQKEGYVTGLYTSPHIATFRERIKIGGEMISEEEMAALFHEVQKNMPATFFELATLLSFLYFQHRKVDVAVIETGLGGSWDATNVICPLLSVITSIGFDHMDVLGATLEEIAREKAGIIKKGVPVLIGPDVSYAFMRTIADERESPLYQSLFRCEDYDRENQEVARLALHLIAEHFPVSETSLKIGLSAKPPCRFERYLRTKEVVFDVAHNAHGFVRLLQMLEHTYPRHQIRFVVGFSRGKDIAECARLIEERASAVHLVSGPHPRLASVEELQGAFHGKATRSEESIAVAIHNALEAVSATPEVLVIVGSFFIMSDARKALGIEEPTDPYIWYDPIKVATPESLREFAASGRP